ncbi:MAG TPA: hypothetical protein VKA08_05835 [Balneolales bacterium]|nr:hypothetical protein [Balneolales bacterium]
MLQRLIRYLTALFSAYSFYANPLRYVVALLGITLLPYLLYLFFGTIVTIIILAITVIVLWRKLRKTSHRRAY